MSSSIASHYLLAEDAVAAIADLCDLAEEAGQPLSIRAVRACTDSFSIHQEAGHRLRQAAAQPEPPLALDPAA